MAAPSEKSSHERNCPRGRALHLKHRRVRQGIVVSRSSMTLREHLDLRQTMQLTKESAFCALVSQDLPEAHYSSPELTLSTKHRWRCPLEGVLRGCSCYYAEIWCARSFGYSLPQHRPGAIG